MDVIIKLRNRLEHKINYTVPALLPNKLNTMRQGPVTSGENIRSKRAIPALAIIQGVAAIGMLGLLRTGPFERLGYICFLFIIRVGYV